jgi:hypothetical protein
LSPVEFTKENTDFLKTCNKTKKNVAPILIKNTRIIDVDRLQKKTVNWEIIHNLSPDKICIRVHNVHTIPPTESWKKKIKHILIQCNVIKGWVIGMHLDPADRSKIILVCKNHKIATYTFWHLQGYFNSLLDQEQKLYNQ